MNFRNIEGLHYEGDPSEWGGGRRGEVFSWPVPTPEPEPQPEPEPTPQGTESRFAKFRN